MKIPMALNGYNLLTLYTQERKKTIHRIDFEKMCKFTKNRKNDSTRTGRNGQKACERWINYVKNEYKNRKKTKKTSNKYSLSRTDVL